jgi:arylsulfatase A-like enzyme
MILSLLSRLNRAMLAGTALCVAAGAAIAAPAGDASRPTPAAKRMNVLFIMADDFRPWTGAYGAKVATPNLDRLAKRGVRFDNAYSQWPICGVSRASLFTGLRPNTIGKANNFEKFRCAQPDIQTLPQYFKNAGYVSVRVGKAYHQGVPNDIGTAGPDDPASWSETVNPSGHDHLKETEAKIINMTPAVGLGRAMAYLPDPMNDEYQTDGKVASEAIAKIKQHGEDNFF